MDRFGRPGSGVRVLNLENRTDVMMSDPADGDQDAYWRIIELGFGEFRISPLDFPESYLAIDNESPPGVTLEEKTNTPRIIWFFEPMNDLDDCRT